MSYQLKLEAKGISNKAWLQLIILVVCRASRRKDTYVFVWKSKEVPCGRYFKLSKVGKMKAPI
tara:strand:+ start:390 stop:578 length:189 start_codon:yes stop_codon:yes gene_type:complete